MKLTDLFSPEEIIRVNAEVAKDSKAVEEDYNEVLPILTACAAHAPEVFRRETIRSGFIIALALINRALKSHTFL